MEQTLTRAMIADAILRKYGAARVAREIDPTDWDARAEWLRREIAASPLFEIAPEPDDPARATGHWIGWLGRCLGDHTPCG